MRKPLCLILFAMLFFTVGVAAQPGIPDDLHTHMDKGSALFEAGNYTAAAAELAKAREASAQASQAERVRLDYMLAECAVRTDGAGGLGAIQAFLETYPNSIYESDARIAAANALYARCDYEGARKEFMAFDPSDVRAGLRDEYNFKSGHTFFMTDDTPSAVNALRQVNQSGRYGVHARYYLAYIDYVGGRYAEAKRGFRALENEPAYSRLVPYYILQLEFLEGNYDYVAANGDALLAGVDGTRAAEISRIMAESWFHKGNYTKTLAYLSRYTQEGGRMKRAEEYLAGYSYYMSGRTNEAVAALSRVAGPDDTLTQNASYHLADCYLRLGDKQRAMQAFAVASSSHHDDAIREDALFNYGKLQYELGGGVFNEAINLLNRYIADYPQSPRIAQAREYLAAAYYNSSDYDAAYEAIKLIPDPDNNIRAAYQKITYFRALEYFGRGDLDTAYAMLEESSRNKYTAKYTALSAFWKGEVMYRRGDFAKAAPFYREYLSLAPASHSEYRMAQYALGYCSFNTGKYADARGWFDKFLAGYKTADSYRADALSRVGDTQFAAREFAAALKSYDAAAAVGTPEKYYARYSSAVTLGFTAGQQKKADALRSIVSAGDGPYVGDAMYELGRTYVGMERFDDGAKMLKQYVDKFPTGEKYLQALSALGLAYQNTNDNRTALGYYKKLIEAAPSSPEARDAMLAVRSIYMDAGDADGYIAFAERSGTETDLSIVTRDSLTYVAAERIHLSGDNGRSAAAMKDYLAKYPRGAYRPQAFYYMAEADQRLGRDDAAIDALKQLSAMHYNGFTVRGAEKLAGMLYDKARYAEAADAYKKLASAAVNPATAGKAWDSYLRSLVHSGAADGALITAADQVLGAAIPDDAARYARSVKAGALSRTGKNAEAMEIYRMLASDTQSAEGAEATYRVAESLYKSGDLTGAEKSVLAFSAKGTSHTYWLGKAFLVLGEVYVAKGDTFQARATLQSIIDGYSPADDGVVAQAREMIAGLGE